MADIVTDEILIEEIRKNPILYDLYRADYRNVKKKESVWISIAEVLGMPVFECQRRWKNLRDKFVREVRLLQSRSGDEGKIREKWPLFDVLSFLRSITKHRQSSGNLTCNLVSQEALNQLPETPSIPLVTETFSLMEESNQDILDCSASIEAVTPEPTELPPRKKQKKLDPLESAIVHKLTNSKVVSANEHFLLSLIPALESLPAKKQSEVKLQFLNILHEAQYVE